MPLIRKELAGSCPGYTWDSDGAVVDVDAVVAGHLLAMPYGGFSEVLLQSEPVGEPEPVQVEGDGEPDPNAEVIEAPAADPPTPKKRPYVRKTAAPAAEVTE